MEDNKKEWISTLKERMEDDFAINEILEYLDDNCEDVDDAMYTLENSDMADSLGLYFTRDTLEIYNDHWHEINDTVDSSVLSDYSFDQGNPIHHIVVIEYYDTQVHEVLDRLIEIKEEKEEDAL